MTEITAARSRRTILLLATAQALYSSCIVIVMATAGIVGLSIAPSPGFATAPVTTFVLGAMFSTIPISLLMQRVGRKPLFAFGAMVSIAGAMLAVYAIMHANFVAFCFATAMQGVFQASSGFYRFAAAENSTANTKSEAISWVLTGGVVAAVLGTLISSNTAHLIDAYPFAGSYLAVSVLALLNLGVIAVLNIAPPLARDAAGPQRAWPGLLRQPRLIVAIAAAIISYSLMNLMMTAAPVAMIGCGFDQKDASWVIQWHVLAMFVPSFFTGQLIKRIGVEIVIALGTGLLAAAAVAGLLGITFGHFAGALILLGLGWNFGFIGATTMLTDCYRTSERGKVQAANDFGISFVMAIASLSSGVLLADFGWPAVATALLPPSTLVLVLLAWLVTRRTQTA